MGIVAVPAGIGGGTLFVPIVGSFFPFHLDFVRGAGPWWRWPVRSAPGRCCCAPGWQACGWRCRWRCCASMGSIGGAALGLVLPAATMQIALGVVVLGIVVLMLFSGKSEFPHVTAPDRLALAWGLNGSPGRQRIGPHR